jgi:hypothetical protein
MQQKTEDWIKNSADLLNCETCFYYYIVWCLFILLKWFDLRVPLICWLFCLFHNDSCHLTSCLTIVLNNSGSLLNNSSSLLRKTLHYCCHIIAIVLQKIIAHWFHFKCRSIAHWHHFKCRCIAHWLHFKCRRIAHWWHFKWRRIALGLLQYNCKFAMKPW